MRREGPSSRISLPSAPSSDSTACMPGCRHDRAPSRGQSRKPVRPSGMTKPSAWRAFLRPAAYRTFWNAPRVEKSQPHGSETSSLPDGGPGQTAESPTGHPPSLPEHPKPEHHGPHVRQDGLPPPPASDRHETGRLPGSSRASSRRRPRPGTSNTPFTSRQP